MSYTEFLQSKVVSDQPTGFVCGDLHPMLFDFQRDIVRWALRRGRAAVFADCGLGKTLMELEWAHHVHEETGGNVLLLAPLAVAQQTAREAAKFGISLEGIRITNYERLHQVGEPGEYTGIVLDESSILKGFDGKLRKQITDFTERIPFRLAASATPAPNDYMELGNHAEFLSVMNTPEMLATFFVHDGGDTSKWRLKGHAEDQFWRWVASWAVCIRKPSDLGYEDRGFILPPLRMHQHTVRVEDCGGFLFPMEGNTMQERNAARRDSIADRVAECAAVVNASTDPWIIWCHLNGESEALAGAIHGAVQVVGADSPEFKEKAFLDFAEGRTRVLVTKPSIAGYGLNWQHCAHMAFVGLSDSYEQLYQAIRRCWRFGQKREVNCHVITAETEGAVVRNIERKEKQAAEMATGMLAHMRETCTANVHGTVRERDEYQAMKPMRIPEWLIAA